MSKVSSSQSYVTADELFRRAADILQIDNCNSELICKQMHETLVLTCVVGLKNVAHGFGDLHAKVTHLCHYYKISATDMMAIHTMRRHSNQGLHLTKEQLLLDIRALSMLISAVFGEAIPSYLIDKIPAKAQQNSKTLRLDKRYIRATVLSWSDESIWVMPETSETIESCCVILDSEKQYAHFDYLPALLRKGMQLNLLDNQIDGKTITPKLIVIEPDYLIDISLLASCFASFGHHPALFTLHRLKNKANTYHTLLGNFASKALDYIIFAENATDISFQTILQNNFKDKALEYCTCQNWQPQQFKTDALCQIQNIKSIVEELQKKCSRYTNILEPSFICEALGLQGRVDWTTTDYHLLVEQKSGRNINIEYNSTNQHGNHHIEAHYVQALLYKAVLKHNFLLSAHTTQTFLLYSKYPLPNALLEVTGLETLVNEAIKLRNSIVAADYDAALYGTETLLSQLCPDVMNTEKLEDSFFQRYLLPQIQQVTLPLQQMDEVEKAYFLRFAQFVLKEQLLAKTGNITGSGHSNADLWSMPLAEKLETGNIFMGLKITKKESISGQGYDRITLKIPNQSDYFLPNFRRGDMVYLYGYHPKGIPDVRRSLLFRGIIESILAHEMVIVLLNAQQNEQVLHIESAESNNKNRVERVYAVEHCAVDTMAANGMNALQNLITAPKNRKDLLLGRRTPLSDNSITLSKSYHKHYDEVVLKAKQATDFFLLIGPPGTGKTSMALRFLVEEELQNCHATILLMAYTNQAVDEMCGMLHHNGFDFIRLGSEFSCNPQYKPYLLDSVIAQNKQLDKLQHRLQTARIIVSTTATLTYKPFIFTLKHFTLAIVDEASQILEPNIIGILSSHFAQSDKADIDKFILIGDYKQLPAVVQQTETDSMVSDVLLHDIGITDCRISLFERLIRNEQHHNRTQFVGTLRRQGRMHPEISAFSNRHFYAEEQIEIVPLSHQQTNNLGYLEQPINALEQLLTHNRLLFYASKFCHEANLSDKVNVDEAKTTANLLAHIYRLSGKAFDPSTTVGVIVPYRNQISMIRKAIEQLNISVLLDICIDTVERYQGSQRDIIIYSFTIQHRYQLDFLTANTFIEQEKTIDRKLNVALTRAKKQLIVLGNEDVLRANALFSLLIDSIKCRI